MAAADVGLLLLSTVPALRLLMRPFEASPMDPVALVVLPFGLIALFVGGLIWMAS